METQRIENASFSTVGVDDSLATHLAVAKLVWLDTQKPRSSVTSSALCQNAHINHSKLFDLRQLIELHCSEEAAFVRRKFDADSKGM